MTPIATYLAILAALFAVLIAHDDRTRLAFAGGLSGLRRRARSSIRNVPDAPNILLATGAAASAMQVGNPAMGTVSRRPQTTAQQAQSNVPFVRLSRRGKITGFSVAGQAFGGLVSQPLKAAGGYLRGFRILVQAVNGTSTGTQVATADAPWNVISSIFLRDPMGQPIIQCSGYSLYLINLFGGQNGQAGTNKVDSLPSFSAMQLTTGAGAGNFQFEIFLPLEFDSAAYCAMASMNASAQPTLLINLAASAAIYSTPPTTLPTLSVTVNEEYWATPIAAPNLAPPQVGSSAQWSEINAAQTVNNAGARVTWPRVGTYIHTMIGVLRDSTGARVANFPATDLTLYIDGVPLIIERYIERQDDVFRQFNIVMPTGVAVWTWRNSTAEQVDQSDTHDVLLPTTPATLIEIGGTWGLVGSPPATLTCVTGELYPVGGIPYTHLAS